MGDLCRIGSRVGSVGWGKLQDPSEVSALGSGYAGTGGCNGTLEIGEVLMLELGLVGE